MVGAVPVGLGRRGALRDQGQVLYIHGRQVKTGAGPTDFTMQPDKPTKLDPRITVTTATVDNLESTSSSLFRWF